jgi:hypothetical protein
METLTPADFEDDNPLSTVSRRVFVKGLGLAVYRFSWVDEVTDLHR